MTFPEVYILISNCLPMYFNVFSNRSCLSLRLKLHNVLIKIRDEGDKWRMYFNPNRAKQAQEVKLSWKAKKVFHPRIYFNNQTTERSVAHKHLELNLDEKLLLTHYMNNKNKRALKSVALLQISPAKFPLESFFTIYRSFIRLPQDYGMLSMVNHWMNLFLIEQDHPNVRLH